MILIEIILICLFSAPLSVRSNCSPRRNAAGISLAIESPLDFLHIAPLLLFSDKL